MKLLTIEIDGTFIPGVLSLCQRYVYPVSAAGIDVSDMNALITDWSPDIETRLTKLSKQGSSQYFIYQEVKKAAPIPVPVQDIICLGINYEEHAKESARYKKEAFAKDRPYAVYFSKRVSLAVADGGEIDSHSGLVDELDYEVELAVILKKEARQVKAEDVESYILGYTIMNDISARKIQTRHKQWYFGKSLDTFAPMGPWIVTMDELPYPPRLAICSKVNGEIRQDSNTECMTHSISDVICELSQAMTLKAGTIIAMGTPAGVGMGFVPPKFLKPGDEISCSIENIGTLTNYVI